MRRRDSLAVFDIFTEINAQIITKIMCIKRTIISEGVHITQKAYVLAFDTVN